MSDFDSCDDSLSVWEGFEESAADAMAAEHQLQNVPTQTALLRRTCPTYVETMWIQGYPRLRNIFVICPAVGEQPGVIRSLPVGYRDMASAQMFRACFLRVVASYEANGWVRKSVDARSEGKA